MSAQSPGERIQEEAAWIAQALSGQPRGFERIVERYHAPVERLLRVMVRNHEDAEDLLQETFLRAHRFLHRFDVARPFGPWIMRIAANLAKNHLRGRSGWLTVSLDEAPEGEDEPVQGRWLADVSCLREIEYRELLDATQRALASLPDEFRIVMEMRAIGEMSYEEIADALAVPIGTVMSRLNRARHRLQSALAEYSAAPKRTKPRRALEPQAAPEEQAP
jgi:RNA polymerase sigma-70 factor (ECF subfamily)